jgi:hypothetical protein
MNAAEIKAGESEGSHNTLVRWKNDSPLVVEAIQKLLTDGSSIDVRVRYFLLRTLLPRTML